MLETVSRWRILRIFDSGLPLAPDGRHRPWLEQFFVSGGCLLDVIPYLTSLDQLSTFHQHKIIYRLASAVMFLHSAKEVHRQIRANTLRLDRNREIYLGAFRAGADGRARDARSKRGLLGRAGDAHIFALQSSRRRRDGHLRAADRILHTFKNNRLLLPEKVQKMKAKEVRPQTPELLSDEAYHS
jgi:hypothetical protein